MDFSAWEIPDPAELLVLGSDSDWDALSQRYDGNRSRALRRCLEVARSGGCSSVVIETRYLDIDYRSEYSAFYARTFEHVPDSTHRIHFFRGVLQPQQIWNLPEQHGYLGYVVIRPSAMAPVGRTVLSPPPGFEEAVRTSIREPVNFFGQELFAEGVPFVEQDTQLGRCAHAAAWLCHYTAFRKGDVARRPIADFSLVAEPGLGWGRPLPSEGLTVQQLLELLRVFDLPAKFYNVDQLPQSPLAPWEEEVMPIANEQLGDSHTRLIRIVCRYLNSGIPVLVGTSDHAFVLCGYERQVRPGEPDWITFIRNDDQRGPYLRVGNVLNDIDTPSNYSYSPWDCLIVPLPEKLWLTPEPVEKVAGTFLMNLAEATKTNVASAQTLLERIADKQIALRTYAVASNSFKLGLEGRLDPRVAREYRLARMPRFVWIVEAIDRSLREAKQPPVLGEAIFDATSSEYMPNVLGIHVPGVAWVGRTDGTARYPIMCSPSPYESGGIGPP